MSNAFLTIRKLFPILLLAGAISQGADHELSPGLPQAIDIRIWLKQLASREPELRQDATRRLMGIAPGQLSLVRDYFASNHCRPAQRDGLERAITYVIMREKINQPASSPGAFLGLHFLDDPLETFDDDPSSSIGVVVAPIPGFVSERFIEDGDIITGLGQGETFQPMRHHQQFAPYLRNFQPGEPITVHLYRGQKLLKFTYALDAAPADMQTPQAMFERIERARDEADHYWTSEFAPELGRYERD